MTGRPLRFDRKTAIVTAAGSGIGRATAAVLAQEGAAVVVSDIDFAAAELAAAEIVADGGTAIAQSCDVASPDEWARLASVAREAYGSIDMVANNAHAVVVKPAHLQRDEELDRQFAVSLRQVFNAVRACIDDLVRAKGAFTMMSSVHALQSSSGYSAYAAAKGALGALARQLAVEYGPDVRFNAVLPGAVETPGWKGISAAARAHYESAVVLKRFATAREVADAVAFLLSGEASYITGASLVVDGGLTSILAWDALPRAGEIGSGGADHRQAADSPGGRP